MIEQLDFFASTVKCYTENEVLTIGFGDDDKTPKNYVIITRLDDELTDKNDQIGIQTNLSEREYSKAVHEVILNKYEIKIIINKNKKDIVGAEVIKIKFDKENINIKILSQYISKVFNGTDTKVYIY